MLGLLSTSLLRQTHWSLRTAADVEKSGDAAGFIDPLFSTGIFLAMNGGNLAAKTVDGIFKEPGRTEELLEKYQESYVDFFDTIISFVHFFYDPNQTKENYWERAQLLVDPFKEWPARKDFIRLISGLAGIKHVMKIAAKE
jgi:clorobiocin biosynthesis protein Clo-hal